MVDWGIPLPMFTLSSDVDSSIGSPLQHNTGWPSNAAQYSNRRCEQGDTSTRNCHIIIRSKKNMNLIKSDFGSNMVISSGQQKVREHGSAALRKWQTKLRKWCKLAIKKKKRKRRKEKKRTKGKWGKQRKGKRRGRGKEKERRRGLDILKKL